MKLDMNKLRDRQLEASNGGGYFKPKNGKNIIRILTFTHTVTKVDVEAGYFKKEDLGKEKVELERVMVRHFHIAERGPVLSTPEIMKEYQRLSASGDPSDLKRAEDIKPSKAYFLNVVDMDNKDRGVVPFAASKTVYLAIVNVLIDDEFGTDVLGCEGRDFIINYNKDASPVNMYSVTLRDQKNSEKLPSDAQDSVVDFYGPEGLSAMGFTSSSNTMTTPEEGDQKESTSSVEKDVEDIFGNGQEKAVGKAETTSTFKRRK